MSVHTDTSGIRTTWSIRERWSGSSVELPNFIKWLRQHSEGEVNSYFYQKIIDGEDIFNLLPDTHIASAVYRTSDGGTSDFATEPDGSQRVVVTEETGVSPPNRKWWTEAQRANNPERARWVSQITHILSCTQDITMTHRWVNFDQKDHQNRYTDFHIMELLKKIKVNFYKWVDQFLEPNGQAKSVHTSVSRQISVWISYPDGGMCVLYHP